MNILEILFLLCIPIYLVGAVVISNWLTERVSQKLWYLRLKIWKWRAIAIRNNRTNR